MSSILRTKKIALVDCNSFYVSCERLFNPKIRKKPVVVLSNNDGCIISRSNEAKALGIKMGEPYFKEKDIIVKNNVQVFSSNYSLYGDLSRRVMRTLKRFNSKNEGIFYKNETTVKTRLIANNQQIARIDWESQIIKGGGISKYENSIEKALKQSNAVIISDYNKGFCTPALTQFIIELCNAKSLPVFVDPKGDDFNKYKGANFIKPNQYEAQAVTPFKLETDNDYINSAELIREKFKIQTCIITMGERGMIYSSDDITEKIDTVAKKVYDVSGAGDTVIATLASFASIGVNALLATKIANIAAGTVISYRGTYPINIELLSKAIKENNL